MDSHRISIGKSDVQPRKRGQESNKDLWFPAKAILDENEHQYLVSWFGKNPSTNEEWPSSWVQ